MSSVMAGDNAATELRWCGVEQAQAPQMELAILTTVSMMYHK